MDVIFPKSTSHHEFTAPAAVDAHAFSAVLRECVPSFALAAGYIVEYADEAVAFLLKAAFSVCR
jgi:hypothetical protein